MTWIKEKLRTLGGPWHFDHQPWPRPEVKRTGSDLAALFKATVAQVQADLEKFNSFTGQDRAVQLSWTEGLAVVRWRGHEKPIVTLRIDEKASAIRYILAATKSDSNEPISGELGTETDVAQLSRLLLEPVLF